MAARTRTLGGVFPHGKVIVTGKIGHLRGDLLHYSMESIEHQIGKGIRYADEFAQAHWEQGATRYIS